MTKTKECKNCWFYCHADGRCYVDPRSAHDDNYALRVVMAQPCTDWQFDGLQDWEREDTEALVTMDIRTP